MNEENTSVDVLGVTIDSALTDSSPLTQLNMLILLDKCRNDLSDRSLRVIEEYLPKMRDYSALKIALHILLDKSQRKASLLSTFEKVESVWPACSRRLNLVAAARRKLSVVHLIS